MDRPIFSIIVPVFHEAERINDLIAHLRHLGPEKEREIIVVDGAPEKDTLPVIRDDRVVKISSEKGRAKQMNAGASVARGRSWSFSMQIQSYPPVRSIGSARLSAKENMWEALLI